MGRTDDERGFTESIMSITEEIVQEMSDLRKKDRVRRVYQSLLMKDEEEYESGEGYVNTVKGAMAAIVFLYKNNKIKDGIDVDEYIKGNIKEILEYSKKNEQLDYEKIKSDIINIERLMREKISSETWDKLSIKSRPEIKVTYWNNLGRPLNIYGGDKASLEHVINEIKDENDDWFTVGGDPKEGNYNDYFRRLDEEISSSYESPDLVMIDSVRVAEYEAKGILDKIHDYSVVRQEVEQLDKEKSLGKTINGRIVATPITRNFHLPAIGNMKDKRGCDIFDMLLDVFWETDNEEVYHGSMEDLVEDTEAREHNADEPIGTAVRLSWENPKESRYYPFSNYATDSEDKSERLVTEMMGGGYPFIPMQLARGAHVAYTFFAYMAGIEPLQRKYENIYSLIDVDKDNGYTVNMMHQVGGRTDQNEQERAYLFLKLIYLYAPFISLYLDHEKAGIIRDEKKGIWFDPCLPIEASYFQDRDVNFQSTPIRADNMSEAKLSCLGGYCLALTSRGDDKGDASSISYRIAKKYFESGVRSTIDEELHQTRIGYDYDDKPDNYYNTPEQIAQRPHFEGWSLIRNSISKTVRLYVASLMVFRSIFAEAVMLTSQDQAQRLEYSEGLAEKYKIENPSISDSILELNRGDNFLRFYLQGSTSNNLDPLLTVHNIERFIESIEHHIEAYLHENMGSRYDDYNLNIGSIKYSASSIYGVLSSTFEDLNNKTNKITSDLVIDILASRMMQELTGKIKDICEREGWEFNDVN